MAQADPTSTTSTESRKTATPTFTDPGYKLREVVRAMGAVADLIEDVHPSSSPDGETVATILRAFAYAIDGVGLPRIILQ